MHMLGVVEPLLLNYPLCNNCLGRMFSRLGGSMSNYERGAILKGYLLIEAELRLLEEGDAELLTALCRSGFERACEVAGKHGLRIGVEKCPVCGGLFARIGEVGERAVEMLRGYEFESFHVGSTIPGWMAEAEDRIRSEFSLSYGESLKTELNREIGKYIAARVGARVEFRRPDIVVHYDAINDTVSVEVRPVYIYGRYLKFLRGLRQTRIVEAPCEGEECIDEEGRLLFEGVSVEALLAPMFYRPHGGSEAILHAAGREDIDVRMLGTGRPFVMEVREPRRRRVDLEALKKSINGRFRGLVAVRMLRYVGPEVVRKINVYSSIHEKRYILRVRVDGGISEEEVRRVERALTGRTVKQRTPRRVLWRRVDKVRSKRVYRVRGFKTGPDTAMFDITCQGGLYIKELATGDEGRTRPSISQILGKSVEVLSLDVVAVAPDLEEKLFGANP